LRWFPSTTLPGRSCGLIGLLLCFALSGCSINPKVDLFSVTTDAQVMLDVPFFPQAEFQCGPAALATVLVAAGVDTTPELLTPQVYLPDRQGSLQLELLAATRRAGRIPYVIGNDLAMLFSELEQDRPVLVLQNLQTRQFPVWHYAVLMGFDTTTDQVFLNTGTRQHEAMSAEKFARLWDWGGNWAMVVLAAGEIPPGANAGTYFQAVANFEAVAGNAAAEPAWRAGLKRWPDHPQAYLALGNQAYAKGDLQQASALYRQGLAVDANNIGLSNNLATVLGELGCPREGEKLLQSAVAGLSADSAWQEIIKATLQELAASTASPDANCRTR